MTLIHKLSFRDSYYKCQMIEPLRLTDNEKKNTLTV